MAKLVLNDIDSLANTASAKQALNENFTDIEAAIENTLSRDGTTPNQMQADIDMNSNDLLNAGRVDAVEYLKNGVPFEQSVAYANKLFDLFSGTGAQTQFTMQTDPGSLGNLYVSVGGSDMKPGIDYNYAGNVLTFVVAPAAGTNNIYVRYDRALATEDSVLRQDLALSTADKGADLVTYKQPISGTVARTATSKMSDHASIEDFGGVGDNVFDNTAAFAAAEASTFKWVYLPEGTFYHAGPLLRQKHYYGPGVIRGSAVDYFPARLTNMTTRPFAGSGTGYNKFFNADLTSTDASYFINRADRIGLTELYYAPETSEKLAIYDNGAGTGGVDARFSLATLVGATSATLNSTAGLATGDVVTFFNPDTGNTSAQKTITVAGSTISWSGGLTEAMPAGSQVSLGGRTMHSQNHLELLHSGGGDAYINLMRVYVGGNWAAKPGKDHVFFTNTGGMDGGDIVAQADHVYMTGREITFDGLSYDVAVLGDIRTFGRNNATGARGAFWMGTLYKSEGTQACDAAHSVTGRWKSAFDTVRGFFADNGGCAINMGGDQYIYCDSSGSAGTAANPYPAQWGDVLGNTKHGYNTATNAWELTVDGSLVARVNGTKYIVTAEFEVQDEIRSPVTGGVSGLHNNPAGMAGAAVDYVGSGTYTPTLFNTTNVAASSAFVCQYMRVGRVVTVSGQVGITPTAASVSTILGMSLPIASNLAGAREVGGTAACGTAANMVAAVSGDPTNDRALVTFFPPNNAANNWSFSFSYLVA